MCEASNNLYAAFPEKVQAAMDSFGSKTGRKYNLFDYYGHKDAEEVVVIAGAGGVPAQQVVDYLNKNGRKVCFMLFSRHLCNQPFRLVSSRPVSSVPSPSSTSCLRCLAPSRRLLFSTGILVFSLCCYLVGHVQCAQFYDCVEPRSLEPSANPCMLILSWLCMRLTAAQRFDSFLPTVLLTCLGLRWTLWSRIQGLYSRYGRSSLQQPPPGQACQPLHRWYHWWRVLQESWRRRTQH